MKRYVRYGYSKSSLKRRQRLRNALDKPPKLVPEVEEPPVPVGTRGKCLICIHLLYIIFMLSKIYTRVTYYYLG